MKDPIYTPGLNPAISLYRYLDALLYSIQGERRTSCNDWVPGRRAWGHYTSPAVGWGLDGMSAWYGYDEPEGAVIMIGDRYVNSYGDARYARLAMLPNGHFAVGHLWGHKLRMNLERASFLAMGWHGTRSRVWGVQGSLGTKTAPDLTRNYLSDDLLGSWYWQRLERADWGWFIRPVQPLANMLMDGGDPQTATSFTIYQQRLDAFDALMQRRHRREINKQRRQQGQAPLSGRGARLRHGSTTLDPQESIMAMAALLDASSPARTTRPIEALEAH